MLALQNMSDEMEREKARQRTYDEALDRKARAGHVVGGRVFGYDNHQHNKKQRQLPKALLETLYQFS